MRECGPHDTAPQVTGYTGASGVMCLSSGGSLQKTVSYILSQYGSGGANVNTPPFLSNPLLKPTTTTVTLPTSGGSNLVSRTVIRPLPKYGSCQLYEGLNLQPQPGVSNPAPTYQTISPCYSTNQTQMTTYYDFGVSAPRLPAQDGHNTVSLAGLFPGPQLFSCEPDQSRRDAVHRLCHDDVWIRSEWKSARRPGQSHIGYAYEQLRRVTNNTDRLQLSGFADFVDRCEMETRLQSPHISVRAHFLSRSSNHTRVQPLCPRPPLMSTTAIRVL